MTPDYPNSVPWRWPAEWEPHLATWLTWPRRSGISFPGCYDAAAQAWVELVSRVSPHEQVHINISDDLQLEQVERQCATRRLGSVPHFHRIASNEPWCRDHGAQFLLSSSRRLRSAVNWEYNAWGEKYPPWDLDNLVAESMAQRIGSPCQSPGIVLEGGAIDGNGQGDLLTTRSCLLNPNRNPQLDQGHIEQTLRHYLGAERIHWLAEGIEGDDTDGHVDDVARFVGPNTIAAAVETDSSDRNYLPLQRNLDCLKRLRDRNGKAFNLVPIPMPEPIYWNGQRLPASYLNFYVANQQVIVPQFGDPCDQTALKLFGELFGGREAIGLNARDLIVGLGAFHCITQQVPATIEERPAEAPS